MSIFISSEEEHVMLCNERVRECSLGFGWSRERV